VKNVVRRILTFNLALCKSDLCNIKWFCRYSNRCKKYQLCYI